MKNFTSSRIIFGIFLVTSILFIVFGYQQIIDRWPSFVSFFILWITTFIKMLYDTWDRFNLTINRVKARLFNVATTWEISAEYSVNSIDNEYILDGITQSIKAVFPSIKFKENSRYQKTIQINDFTFFIRESLDSSSSLLGNEDSVSIHIEIAKVTIPFRQTEDVLDRDILPIFNLVEKSLLPQTSKYILDINYGKNNPFYGLYVKRLPIDKIMKFSCEISEDIAGNKTYITIGAKKVTIISNNSNNLSFVSRKYLLMSTFR
jgi:hypothetical protein